MRFNLKCLVVMLALIFFPVILPPVYAQPPNHIKNPDLSPLRQGDFLLLSKRPQEALQVFQQLWQEEPGNSYAVRGMVRAYHALAQLPQAISLLNQSLEKSKQSSPSAYGLGYVWYLQGRYEEARGKLEEAIRFDPGNALALNALAATLVELKDFEEALKHVRRAVVLVPEELMFYRNLKMIYVRSGQADKFEKEYRQYLKEGDRTRARSYGMILAQQKRQAAFKLYVEGKIEETLTAMSDMLDIYREIDHSPGIVAGLFSLGALYEEQGKTDRAVVYYREVLKINPQHIQAREKMRFLGPKKE